MQQLTISQLLTFSQQKLEEAGVEDPSTDSWLLLGSILGLSRTGLYLAANDTVDESDYTQFLQLLEKRIRREPVAYILGHKEFWSLPFFVTNDVLIPRPETEFMLDKVFSIIDRERVSRCLDLCCGSGAIACVLASELQLEVVAVDISPAAIEVTRKNIANLKLGALVKPFWSDLFDRLEISAPFSLIVSNPPYIRTEDVRCNLEPEVSGYEPHLALDGGSEGMDVIIRIAEKVSSYLEPEGHFFMEIGSDQGQMCKDCFDGTKKFAKVELFQDYSGRDRVLHCTV